MFNLRLGGTIGGSVVLSDGKVGEGDVDIQGSKVVAPVYVSGGPFVVEH
jgi:hypothetical protein